MEDGEEEKARSRFVVKMVCRHGKYTFHTIEQFLTSRAGVLKTYRLTFESIVPMHALFVKESAKNYWSISSKTLKEFVEHFGPGTEQLDICCEDGRVSFTSYIERITSGNGKPGTPYKCYEALIAV